MERFDLEVREGDETLAVERAVELATSNDLWTRVAGLAESMYAPGRTIRVTNGVGEQIVLIGVAAALRYGTPFGA
jgi:hypothetical protein